MTDYQNKAPRFIVIRLFFFLLSLLPKKCRLFQSMIHFLPCYNLMYVLALFGFFSLIMKLKKVMDNQKSELRSRKAIFDRCLFSWKYKISQKKKNLLNCYGERMTESLSIQIIIISFCDSKQARLHNLKH